MPRPVPFNLAGTLSEKPQWDFRESIFSKYKPDTNKILDGCFETDWEFTKIPKLLKYDPAQIKKLKEYMKANYKGLREVYKYFAGVQAMRVASLASSGLVEILKHCDKPVGWKAGDPLKPFIDGRIFKASDVEF